MEHQRRARFALHIPPAQRAALRQLETLRDRNIRVTVSTNLSPDQVSLFRNAASAIRRLDDRTAVVDLITNLDEDTVRALRNAASAIRRLDSRNVVVRVDLQVDEAQLERIALLLREMRDTSVNVRVNSNADTVATRVRSLNRELGYMPGIAGGIAAVSAAIAAIGGAAGAALGAVGGLAVGLLSLGPAVGGIFATLAVGAQGLGDAFTAMGNVTANAASEAEAQSEAISSAQNQVASANDAVISSQEALDAAYADSEQAAKDVADAYKQAERDLRDYQLTAQEAALSEKEAAFALEDAQKAVLEARNPDEHERAILRVQQAELRLLRAQDRAKEAAEENAEAQEKGIENSDAVTEARDKQAAADQRVTQAERQAAAASRQLDQATQALEKAQSKATPSVEKFNQALAELSPNARAFVLAAQAAKPAWDSFTDGIQDNLFANLGRELSETANVVLPAIQESMGGVASALNEAAVNAADFLQSERGIALLNSTFEASEGLIRGMLSGTGELTQGWLDFTTTVAPRMDEVGRAIAAMGEGIGRALSGAAESGALDQLITNFAGFLTSMGPFLEDLVTTLITLGNAILPSLGTFFEALGDALVDIAPAIGELGAVFLNSLTEILPSLSELITALAEGLKPVLPVLTQLIKVMADAIEPLIPIFSQITSTVGSALVQAIQALQPALPPVAQAFADLLNAVSPLIPLIAENLSVVLQALAPALSEIFNALAPVIKQFAEGMKPVIQEIAPVLKDVAMQMGVALADAIKELTPHLPGLIQAFGDLILAIIPILPELMELAVEVIPPLTRALVEIAPILVEMANVFVWVVTNIIDGVVIPAINHMREQWGNFFDAIGTAVDWVKNTAFPKLQEALGAVKGWFADTVDTAVAKCEELREKAAAPVNFVIDTVWNNGLLKAWGSIDNLLGGVLPDASPLPLIPRRATGGPLSYLHGGSGNGTKDDMLFWGSNNEHVITSDEVIKAGGQNIIFAIRDMIARGIPFTWDNGRIISELGRDNLNRYGAAVRQHGIGNVPPEGLFDQLARVPIPQFRDGGPIFPWMYQLKAGHDFARAQNGKPYQWAGPTGPGSSFDCSGFMGSIAAAILGDNPWQRYWATSSFAGYPAVGPQGFTRNLFEGIGMLVGITDDPGGPGGGHTAGELKGIPELGIPAARVESGGDLGDVHYGRGTNPASFASLYGLPIGANGFFQPSPGGSSVGPSTTEQQSYLERTINRIVTTATDPVRDLIRTVIGAPPPSVRGIPLGALDATQKAAVEVASKAVGNLGGLLGGAWQKAQDLGERVLDFVNPFDSGGIASGTGFMPKNVIAPERVLSPQQTELFEALVRALQSIAGGTAHVTADAVASDTVFQERLDAAFTEQGELISDSMTSVERNQSSIAEEQATTARIQSDTLASISGKLAADVLGPVLSSAVNAGVGFFTDLIEALGKDIVAAQNGTTRAVQSLEDGTTGGGGAPAPFGAPGSAFDFASAASAAVVEVANTASQAFQKVANDIANAALAQSPSRVSESRGTLGEDDISGGFLVDLIVRLTGVEIEILDTLEKTYDEILSFREGAFTGFEASGELISDTAAMVQRNQSSIELAAKEQERIQKALIKAVIKYLIVNVLLPIITAILGAMITLATTAIGAAIGSAIPVIGTAIGAAVGAAVGAALSGLAAVFTSLLAVGAGAAIDAFDEGGIAPGVGYMPKNTIAPERVLSPRQTTAFETLVGVLDRNMTGNRTVQIGSVNVNGRDPAQKTADNLLALLNT